MTGVSAVTAFSTLVIGAIGISMMLVGGSSIRAGTMTIGDFVMYLTFTALITVPIIQLASIGTQMTEAFAGLDRIREIRRWRPKTTRTRAGWRCPTSAARWRSTT